MVFKKPYFGPPPNGYIAGLGRGAVGFITRGDVAKQPELTFGGQQLNAPPGLARKPEPQQRPDTSEANFDEWSGYGGNLFAGLKEDQEDKDADACYAQVDDYLMGRRHKKQQQKIEELNRVYAQDQVNIKSKFVEAKRKLADVSREDWESLPDAMDLVKQNKKRKLNEKQRYTPVPDSVLQANGSYGQMDNQIDAITAMPGGATSSLQDGTQSTIAEVGEARQKLFQLEMNRAQTQIGTTTSQINREGYITDLNSMKVNTATEINDLKKARVLLKAVIKANPQSSSGWVAAARVEELDGKLSEARKILQEACDQFPNSEDVWFEAARIQEPLHQQSFLAKAVQTIPTSRKIWQLAASKEDDPSQKSKILRRALEQLPLEVELWMNLVELENQQEALILLKKAVTCVPNAVTLWLAWAKLEDYNSAKYVLNQALSKNPQSIDIYMAAAKLEEAQQNIDKIPTIVRRMVKNLKISRDQFLQEAVKCETQDSLLSCEVIVDQSIMLGLESMSIKQLKQVWISNVDICVSQKAVFTARFILKSALKLHDRRALWMKAYQIEQQFGSSISQLKLLDRAQNSKHTFLQLLQAKLLWKQLKQPEKAIQILQRQEQSSEIRLAISKIMRHLGQSENALQVLQQGDQEDARILMQIVQIYRASNQESKALEACKKALLLQPQFWKLHLILAQVTEAMTSDIEQVRTVYEHAVSMCGKDWQVFVAAARFEIKSDAVTRARTLLNKARNRLPDSPQVWLESIRIELTANEKIAQHLLSRALQTCPDSGPLWALAIEMEPQATRMRKSTDAVTKNKNCPHIFLAIGKMFWAEGKVQKARKFLERAVELDKDFADAWLYLYKFETIHNSEAAQQIKKDFDDQEPKHGELWQKYSKRPNNWSRPHGEILEQVDIAIPRLF